MSHDIEMIRKAFATAHGIITGKRADNGVPYMSIPADPHRDADLILCDTIEEVARLRARVGELEGIVEDVGVLVGKLSNVGGGLIVRHGPEVSHAKATRDWWDRLVAVAVTIRATHGGTDGAR